MLRLGSESVIVLADESPRAYIPFHPAVKSKQPRYFYVPLNSFVSFFTPANIRIYFKVNSF